MSKYSAHMERLGRLFDASWMPLFLLLSVSWLCAPLLQQVHYGNLAVISHYEAVDQPFNWLFRLCDVLAAALLAAAIWRYQLQSRNRLLTVLLYSVASLAAIDALFPVGCNGLCSAWNALSEGVHDGESVLATLAVLAATIVAWRRYRHWVHTLFLGAQIAAGLALLSGVVGHQQLIVIQFMYQAGLACWLAWLVASLAPPLPLNVAWRAAIRRGFGLLAAGFGVISILVAVPHHYRFGWLHFAAVEHPAWLAEHSIIVGVLLLYISRQVSRGERRAAMLMGVLFAVLTLRFALFQPHGLLLGASLGSFVLLWWGRDAFMRNVDPLPLLARLQNVGVVLVGVLAVMGLVLLFAVGTSKQQVLYKSLGRVYRRDAAAVYRQNTGIVRSERRLRALSGTLWLSVGALTLWSLFRPSGRSAPTTPAAHRLAASILARHSNSTEDFFKLWPADKHYFFNAAQSGFVAYRPVGRIVFALADPVAPPGERAALLAAFTAFCRARGWSVCFLLVQAGSKQLYVKDLKLLHIGASAVIDVAQFVTTTQREKWWRWQANRAQRAGYWYEVIEPPQCAAVLTEVNVLSDIWLQRSGHREQGFALGYFDKDYLRQCRLHMLRDNNGQLVAFANELPAMTGLRERTVDLIRFLPDIDGAMPVLIMHIVRHLYETGEAKRFDLGFVPLARLDSTVGTIARRLVQGRFSAAGLEQFKNKFRPDWTPNYIAYDGDVVDLAYVLTSLETVLRVDDRATGE